MIIDVAMRTDKGMVRTQNEDAVGGDPSVGLIILADGMGGANAGEVASQLAVDLLVNQLVPEDDETELPGSDALLEAMHGVNQAILELSQQVPDYQGMGTTLVVGLFRRQTLIHAHVGDSRLYRFREGVMECLTSDHTLIQEMVDMGDFATLEEARLAGVPHNVLTRAFGAEPAVAVDLAECEIAVGDIYLFCSDGLTVMLTDPEIQSILQRCGEDLMEQTDELIELACSRGGIDNISVILARVIEPSE
ncbi:MAG: protein phosphatase 2C domain-containing protein [Candidatus Thiodiazotropha sp.]